MTTHDLLNQLIADRDRLTIAIAVLAERCGRPTPAPDAPLVYAGAPPDPDGHARPETAPPSRRAKPKSAKPRTAMAAHDAPPPRRNGHPLLRERIVTALHGRPSAAWDDIIDACQPTTPGSLQICLRECVEAGVVERVGYGKYALPTRVVSAEGDA